VYDDVNGNPQALTGRLQVALQQARLVGGGAAAGHRPRRRRDRGLSLFANFTVHDKATNVVDNYQQVGLVYKGAVRRPSQG
jgi:porin